MTTTVTLTRQPSGCWCTSVRRTHLVGTHLRAESLPDLVSPAAVVRVTAHAHTESIGGRPRCWLIIDGWQRWPIHAIGHGDTLTVETTDEPQSLETALRAPIGHDGPMTFDQAADFVAQVDSRYDMAARQVPVLPGTRGRHPFRDAFTPQRPSLPPTTRSYYTRGRVRRIPETGRWAADQGWAGSTRPLGERATQAEAEAAVHASIDRAWEQLAEWLRRYVHGPWTLIRLPIEEIEVQDRINAEQAAALWDVEVSTWRAYVSRGQAPAAGGTDKSGRRWWHRPDVLNWDRPRVGAR